MGKMDVTRKQAVRQLGDLRNLGRNMRLAADDWKTPFQTLTAIIMSARTRDEVTIKVAKKLFARYPDAKSLSRAPLRTVERIVKPVNFFHNKAKSVMGCAKKLDKDFDGHPPKDIEALTILPGVGRKTANVFLAQYGHDTIGVDTHVAYLSRRLRWTRNHDPKKIEKDLEKLFPRRLWRTVNEICVRFGKTHMSRKEKDMILDEIRSL